MIWDDLRSFIAANQSFLISSHMSLDGDAIGSQLSLFWYLKSLGKDVQIFTHDPIPAKFRFLSNCQYVTNEKPQTTFDVLAILDSSNPARLGWTGVETIAKQILVIDHHRDNSKCGVINIVDTAAAATGELIYQCLVALGAEIPPFVAEALYTAIVSDTGGFRFSNTNSRVLRICADLADRGADCSKIFKKVYVSHSSQALMLQSRIWSSLQFFLGGKVCCMGMPLSILSELNAQYSDSEGMADNTVTAEGVEVGIFTKYSDTESHFSLRSKGSVDVGMIAQKIPGGGGHSGAAGCTILMPHDKAMAYMLEMIEEELR
jgi:bifunctional oligoribonuclease and PAP phosphatase NrnA